MRRVHAYYYRARLTCTYMLLPSACGGRIFTQLPVNPAASVADTSLLSLDMNSRVLSNAGNSIKTKQWQATSMEI